jgi:predicted nucleic acid binding AN1-type Zn finger protein
LNTKYPDTKIHHFVKAYVKSKGGELTEQSDEVFSVKYPNESSPKEYAYQPALSRERKIPLITPGSPAFQQILKESLENGVLCQILLNPKGEIDTLLKKYFKDLPFSCEDCDKVTSGDEVISACVKSPPCYHQINNGKIVSVKVIKKEPVRYFLFYFSATFQNKLRPRNEETITLLIGEEDNFVSAGEFSEDNFLTNDALEIQDFKAKLQVAVFDKLKKVADEKLESIIKEKLVLFDLTLAKEKKSKLRSFDKRLRRERREKVISRKHDFDLPQWRANYEELLKREEESFITNIAVKFINLLVINTNKIRFEINLDNKSTIRSSTILGVDHASEVTCPICRKPFSEGYATQDSLYVCKSCIRQSVDTAKIYSKKAALSLDETLNEYFEHDSGFVCAVCGKRHSRLLEFKCSHDNSSLCIHHYGLCDVCGKIFSKLNLTYTEEFKWKLCPVHAKRELRER